MSWSYCSARVARTGRAPQAAARSAERVRASPATGSARPCCAPLILYCCGEGRERLCQRVQATSREEGKRRRTSRVRNWVCTGTRARRRPSGTTSRTRRPPEVLSGLDGEASPRLEADRRRGCGSSSMRQEARETGSRRCVRDEAGRARRLRRRGGEAVDEGVKARELSVVELAPSGGGVLRRLLHCEAVPTSISTLWEDLASGNASSHTCATTAARRA